MIVKSMIIAVVAVTCIAVVLVVRLEESPSQMETLTGPMTIAVDCEGSFAEGVPWNLSVNASGHAALTLRTVPSFTVIDFKVPQETLSALRRTLIDEGFFRLKEKYGESVPDGSVSSITIIVGRVSKSVEYRFVRENDTDKDQIDSLLVVWRALEGMFDEPRAAHNTEWIDDWLKSK